MDKKTVKILNHYAKLTHTPKKFVVEAFRKIDERKKELYLFSIRASVKILENKSIVDKQKQISDFIGYEKKLGHKLPNFNVLTKKDMAVGRPKGKKFTFKASKGRREYGIPKSWSVITKLFLGGKRADFTVRQDPGRQVIVLDHEPRKPNILTAYVILKT